jgi:hypothetical protein
MTVDIVWKTRDTPVAELIQAHLSGTLTYSELCEAFASRGWSTRYLFEAVVNAERSAQPAPTSTDLDHRE